MKKTFITLAFAAMIGFVYADNDGAKSTEPATEAAIHTVTLAGSVIDFNSGEALTGVEVRIDGTDIKTYTDFDGNFEFDIKPGKYNLIASYISYSNSLVENLDVAKEETPVNIKLQTSK